MGKPKNERNRGQHDSSKKQRKAYLRLEKQSIRRQKREFRKLHRKRNSFRRLWVDYWEQRKQRRNERRRLRVKTAVMRKRIRQARLMGLQDAMRRFLRNPFGIKQPKRKENVLRKQIRNDIKEQRRHQIISFPSRIRSKYQQFGNRKREQWNLTRRRFNDSIAPLTVKSGSGELRSDLLKSALNSTMLFIVAFWVVYFIGQMATVLTAWCYSIPAILHSYKTDWPLYDYSPLYTRKNLILIFGMGPLVCLVISFLTYRLFRATYQTRLKLKLFLVWIIFHGINMFFGAYIAGVITRTGMVFSSAWIFLSQAFDIEEIIFLIVSVVILIIMGFVSTRLFILSSLTEGIIYRRIRFYYMVAQVFLPWLFGNLVIFLTNYPNNPLNLLLLQGFSFLLVLPVFFNYNAPSTQRFKLNLPLKGIKTSWLYILIFAVFTLCIRMFIYPGILFG